MNASQVINLLVAVALCAPMGVRAQTNGSGTITIQADQPGAHIGSNLFGIFFEEISFAGEGGLYAEMVRNRALGNSTNPDYWTLVTSGTATGQMTVDAGRPLNTNILRSLKLTKQSGTGGVGAANAGFWGMNLQQGAIYDLNFYGCSPGGFSGPLSVRLESADGSQVYAQTSFSGLTTNWQRFAASLVPNQSDSNARLVLSISNTATIWLNVVSLFPRATFHTRTNGMRADLANMLADMNPTFMRFPGGNYVEGSVLADAVRWKKTIGDIANRPGHRNSAWNYHSTDGLGYHEYLQLCEDLGAEPLFVIHCGLSLGYNGSTNNTVPLDQMGPWVQDALDAIEYANGDTNTTWGAQRAANGHPAPFNLKYIEIGNENGGSYYSDRYALFYDAIKSNYPSMNVIACVWGGIPSSRPVEIQDEHYYTSPGTFISYATKYDTYNRSGPKVYVGEYAVTQGYGTWGNLSAALGEAAFMTGMERNADVVIMASYAPLFQNVNFNNWRPDAIYYDSYRLHGTPAYYVQKLFAQNQGDMVLPSAVTITSAATNVSAHGAVGLGSWSTSVQYSNVVVTSNDVVLYQSDFLTAGTNGWRVFKGTWSTNAGLYRQTALTTDCRSTTGDTNWSNYTLTLSARKVSGNEGFLILFNWLDDNNWTWWNIGGWGNTLNGIEQDVNGSKSIVGSQVSQTIQTNQWYNIRIVLTGARIQCYLDGALIHDVTYPGTGSGLYASSSYAKTGGEVIVKAVNPFNAAMATTFNLLGLDSINPTATLIRLTSDSASDENTLAAPTNVFPTIGAITNAGTNFTVVLPANSFSIIRLQASGLHMVTNLQLEVASPLDVGQLVQATLWGWQPGQSDPINLTTNPNHAITWTSGNSSIALVDSSGRVTGTGSGTTSIIATYGSLGLSATQLVQVIGQPVSLVHRYSFDESPGSTNAVDSVGGPYWNGAVLNGGTFGAGNLALAASSQQYLKLPAQILSNYPAVTIESWVTFPTQLPVNCFFFGFGNTNGNLGASYIFCAPRAGRIAITSGTYTSEQNANSGVDFSFRTNFHVTAVFNPPAGYVALYTDGVLAAINNGVTVPMSAVTNAYSYIAKSLYSGDPYPDMTLDELRIYNGALHPDEIVATQLLGPNQLLDESSPVLNGSATGENLTLSWALASAGFTLQSRTNLVIGDWLPVESVVPQLIGGQWQISIPIAGDTRFFRLQK